MEAKIVDLFSRVKREGSPVELEARIGGLTENQFVNLLKRLAEDKTLNAPSFEFTINSIFSRGTYQDQRGMYINDIATLYVDMSGRIIEQKFIRKTKRGGYTLSGVAFNVSTEATIPKLTEPTHKFVRLKMRVSYPLLNAPWKFEATAVYESNDVRTKQQISSTIQKFARSNIGVHNFSEHLKDFNKFEFEAEWTGDRLTAEDLKIGDHLLRLLGDGGSSKIQIAANLAIIDSLVGNNRKSGSIKEAANAVSTLTKDSYLSIYPPIGYYVTDKADGVRCVAILGDNKLTLVTELYVRDIPIARTTKGRTVIDTEMVFASSMISNKTKKHGGYDIEKDVYTLYCFDVLEFEGTNVAQSDFTTRLSYIDKAAAAVNEYHECRPKQYRRIVADISEPLDAIWKTPKSYETDGLIFTAPGNDYKDTKNYKWKPIEKCSIDFLVMKCPKEALGQAPYVERAGSTLYWLFVSVTSEVRNNVGRRDLEWYDILFPNMKHLPKRPFHFTPSYNRFAYMWYAPGGTPDLHGKICELKCDIDREVSDAEPIWHLVKIRDDRDMSRGDFGNAFRTAENIYSLHIDPFTYDDLITAPSSGYFMKNRADAIYKASNNYKRFVITRFIDKFINEPRPKWIVDEASGRGADLNRYKADNVLFTDIDASAIIDLIERRRNTRTGRDNKSLNIGIIHTLVIDLKNRDLKGHIAKFVEPGQVDAIVCNFAIHYLCDDAANISHLLETNAALLKPGGKFMFTTMDGIKIFELLKNMERGGEWVKYDTTNESQRKYAIKKLYDMKTIADCGQTISVLLPMSDVMYEEPLANIDFIVKTASKFGFELVESEPMDLLVDDFRGDSALSADDIFYAGLHRICVLQKKK